MILRGTFVRIDIERLELICFLGRRLALGGDFLHLWQGNILEGNLFGFRGWFRNLIRIAAAKEKKNR
mgnify:CR=1 FL=1